MTYTWTFFRLMAAATQGELTDVIKSVDYQFAATSPEGVTAVYHNTLNFAAADPEDFLPLSEVTEADLIAFAETSLGSTLDGIKASLEAQIANPITERPLPWITTAID